MPYVPRPYESTFEPTETAACLIDAVELSMSFAEVRALRGVSVTARPGEVVGLVGPNGAGKSTALRILAGVLVPDSGEVTVCGICMRQQPSRAKRRLGYVPEAPALYGVLSCREHLDLVATLAGMDSDKATRSADELILDAGLHQFRDASADSLSKGLRQRVAIAGALIHSPDVLLLDEPFDGLDSASLRTVQTWFDYFLKRGGALVISSHDFRLIQGLCHRVIVLANGAKVADESPRGLMAATDCLSLEAAVSSLTVNSAD